MYSGAEWIARSYKTELSQLGVSVANLLGRVFRGIYHLSPNALEKVDWKNEIFMEFTHDCSLSTFDSDDLTALVVYGHDDMVRISIRGCGPRYMKMMFHKRHKREGGICERYPTIESHIETLRSREMAA